MDPVEKPAGQADPKPAGAETKTADQIAAEKVTADAAAAKAVTDQATADAAKATEKATADAKALADAEALVKGARKVPETYELTLPEGDRFGADDLTAIEAIAKAKGWTNDEAQAAIEEHAAALDAQSTHFLTVTKADKEYGGEKLENTQKLAKTALEKLRPAGTPRGDAIRSLLDRSGYGNHIEVVSLLADLGRLMAEDSPSLQTSGGGSKPRDAAAALYGESAS